MTSVHRGALALLIAAAVGIQIHCRRGEEGRGDAPRQEAVGSTNRLPHLDRGEVVPGFEAETIDGERVRIDYPEDGGRTFLFALSPTCGVCMATIPFWNQIAARADGGDRLYGFSVDIGGSYHFQAERKLAEEEKLPFPVLRFADDATTGRYKIENVPHTIVIGPGGRVEAALVGELSDALVDSIFSAPPTLPEAP